MTNRKDDHVQLAKELYKKESLSDFDNIRFVYNSLSEMKLSDVSLKTTVADIKMDYPIFINAMTGGSANTKKINKDLAEVANKTNIAIASGSLSAAIKDESLSDSFKVIRDNNPNGLVFANLGAEYNFNKAKVAIDILNADALQIHLNVIQELVMPEGDRDFTMWLSNIKEIISKSKIPIIVKEVGFGMSRETIKTLLDIKVDAIDVSGYGGTNFAKIENYRRRTMEYSYLNNFGQSTVISLLEAQDFINRTSIIASGGIRNPLDVIKSLALGAKAVGISGLILNHLLEFGIDKTVDLINSWKEELKVIMIILGVNNIDQLREVDLIILNDVKDWCQMREIDYSSFANRQKYKVNKKETKLI